METFNEIRAARLITILSKKIEKHHNDLLDLQREAESFQKPACRVRKEYKKIINNALIDCKRQITIANKYFNHSGLTPKEVAGTKIYSFDNFSYLIRWFEL